MSAPTFTQSDTVLSRTCCVRVDIRASDEVIWSVLTDAEAYPEWNPTVTRIDGRIQDGERIRLHVPGTNRTFTPRVSAVMPARGMVWSDGIAPIFKGTRTFLLTPEGSGLTRFTMEERFTGVVFALFKSKMPDFQPIFEAFAQGLRQTAEGRSR